MLARGLTLIALLVPLVLAGQAEAADRQFVIEMRNADFDVKQITVEPNDRVVLVLYNNDSVSHGGIDIFHNFAVENYVDTVDVLPGEVATVTFTANETGDFLYRCHVVGHTLMRGTLTVRAPAKTPAPEFALVALLVAALAVAARVRTKR